MKTTKLLRMTPLSLLLFAFVITQANAQDSHEHADTVQVKDTHKTDSLSTLPTLWNAIETQQKALHTKLLAKDLDNIHHIAFTIQDLVAMLPEKSKMLTKAKSTSLTKASKRIASLATRLDEAGDAGDSAKIATLVDTLDGELKFIENLYATKDLKPSQGTAGVEQKTYVCPMHLEVTSDKPGACPKCGMDLVVKETQADTAHPHH